MTIDIHHDEIDPYRVIDLLEAGDTILMRETQWLNLASRLRYRKELNQKVKCLINGDIRRVFCDEG